MAPGDATVARGSDVTVKATLSGFDADEADVYTRRSPNAPFERMPLAAGAAVGQFEGIVLDLESPTAYFVQAAGVRSPVYTLQAANLPYVRQLELVLRFPAYTGLEPRTVEHGGDLAVLTGTTVELRATPTMKVAAGQVLMDEATRVPLTVEADGTLTGRFTVTKDGFYRIDLQATSGAMVAASPRSRSTCWPTSHPPCRSRSPGATSGRRASTRCTWRRRPPTTSAWGGSISCPR